MGLLELREAGVADLLEKGADVIAEKGLSKGLRINLQDNSVDPVAALALALGAPVMEVHNSCSLADLGVPAVREAVLILAVEYLEAMLDGSLEEWADLQEVTAEEVQSLFRRTAARIKIAIT
jgi:hypothetical protein